MQLTKFGHSCVRIDDGGHTLVLDPGVFSDIDAALDGADAVLITHEHRDHQDPDALRAALLGDPRLRVWAPSSVAAQFTEFGEQVVTVPGGGESFTAAGLDIRTVGGQHALIHPLIPVVANVGYLIKGRVYHPGDSLIVPREQVQTLLLPSMAPWSKVSEVIDFALSVRAPKAYPIHDALVVAAYGGILQGSLVPILADHAVEFASWDGAVHA